MASYRMVMDEIHVLAVDYDSDLATMLETCHYRVTRVELASVGIRLLLSGKTKFDMIIADINSADRQAFNLLKEAVSRDIPIILMSVEDNVFVAMKATENGAFLYIKKPATMEMLKCLWQHVIIRKKTHMISKRDRLKPNNPNDIGAFNMLMLKDNVDSNKNIRERKGSSWEEELDSNKQMMVTDKTKRKASVKWTQELHDKFMDAVEQLGEGKCFPNDILELMCVPGLTKMQVASHLQRCRENKWRSAKGQRPQLGIQPMLSITNLAKHIRRKYGSMPRLSRTPSSRVNIQETIGTEIEMSNYGAIENMTTEPMETSTFYHEQDGSLAPYPRNAASGSSFLMPI